MISPLCWKSSWWWMIEFMKERDVESLSIFLSPLYNGNYLFELRKELVVPICVSCPNWNIEDGFIQ